MVPSPEASPRAPPSLQWIPWPPLTGALRFSTFTGTMRRYDCSPPIHGCLRSPSAAGTSRDGRRWRALLGSWRIPLEACPELETPAAPVRPHPTGRPGTAFRSHNSVGVRHGFDFGAESSRPASLLCTLRTHRSPGEWQHVLPACWLALAGRDSHPLDSTKRFHWLISAPPLPSFSQRDMRVNSKCAHHVRPPLPRSEAWPERVAGARTSMAGEEASV